MEYEMVGSTDYIQFLREVREYIAAGWKPQGGVAAVKLARENGIAWYQAMVRGET